jgi:hypothetical protein
MGHTNVVVTTAGQVGDIITELTNHGVDSINSGLYGFQSGGTVGARVDRTRFSRRVGTRREFSNLFDEMAAINADVSFAQDFVRVNDMRANWNRHGASHFSRQQVGRTFTFNFAVPVIYHWYARPDLVTRWFENHARTAVNVGAQSVTVGGIGEVVVTHHGRRFQIKSQESIEMLNDSFATVREDLMINAIRPNQYVWGNVDRFLDAPVFGNQYIIMTDTVPFLQMVIGNSMELYAPYSNFSFYTLLDGLRMIDYNTAPSFVVTYESAHHLNQTNFFNFFSTEYAIYEPIIMELYDFIHPIMSRTRGLDWVNREVLVEGVIKNTYLNRAGQEIVVIINYTQMPFTYRGQVVEPVNARLFE